MGIQILFHMLEEDRRTFLSHLLKKNGATASQWTTETPSETEVDIHASEAQTLGIWSYSDVSSEPRRLVKRDDGAIKYVLDRSMAIEFSPSKVVNHADQQGLLQGRLYSFNSIPSKAQSELLRVARTWIKQEYVPCPFDLLGGYVSPSALRWFDNGGVLLPMFNPPKTQPWEEFISKQHGAALGGS